MSVCVLLPSARPDNLRRCLAGLHNVFVSISAVEKNGRRGETYENIVIDDSVSAEVRFRTEREYQLGAVWAWNDIFKFEDLERGHNYYVLAADDLIFHAGWLDHSLAALNSIGGSGLVAFNDLHCDYKEYAAHFLVSADFIANELGGLIYPPHYKSWWADREVSDIAKSCGKYAWAAFAIVEHLHPSFGWAPDDEVYKLAEKNYDADEQTYRTRKAAGFPKDW